MSLCDGPLIDPYRLMHQASIKRQQITKIPIIHQLTDEPPPVEFQDVEARGHRSGRGAVAYHPVVCYGVAEGRSTGQSLPAHDWLMYRCGGNVRGR